MPRAIDTTTPHAAIRLPAWIRRIWQKWTPADSLVFFTNLTTFLLLLGNCWWDSVAVTSLAIGIPVLVQGMASYWWETLRKAWLFGALVGIAWPFGEAAVTETLGWWGEYVAPGPVILYTPLYCLAIGWQASTYIDYLGRRTFEMGFGFGWSLWNVAASAFLLGLIGENMFVAANMWTYTPSSWDWGSIPAFLPIAYAVGYGLRPFQWHRTLLPSGLVFLVWLLVSCCALGWAVGFFPR